MTRLYYFKTKEEKDIYKILSKNNIAPKIIEEHETHFVIEKCDITYGEYFKYKIDLTDKNKLNTKIKQIIKKMHELKIIHRNLIDNNILFKLKNIKGLKVVDEIKIIGFDKAIYSTILKDEEVKLSHSSFTFGKETKRTRTRWCLF